MKVLQVVFTYRQSAVRFEEQFLLLVVLKMASRSFRLRKGDIVFLCVRSECC